MRGTSGREPLETEVSSPASSAGDADRTEALAVQMRPVSETHAATLADAAGAAQHASGTAGPSGAGPSRPGSGELPTEFGRYRIERKLGHGGMGSVYLARDRELDRLVALKVPRFAGEDGPPNLDRFRREARAAATLEHPNICAVYDVGEAGGVHYLTMAYIEGRPLSDLLQQGTPLPERPAADLVRKLALALNEAHAHGVVHRDLKPSNIMINRRHEPVITDFGLARRDRPGEEQLTHSGTILGTPAYMSPEQVEGDPARIGPPSDVYSLGVMFYELLTGQRPFQGSVASIFSQILRDEPRRPGELRPGLDPRLEALCMKALNKAPADRLSMGDLAAALTDYLEQTGASAPVVDDRTGTVTLPGQPRPAAEPQAETVAMGSAPTTTVAAGRPHDPHSETGPATQLLAQLAARLERVERDSVVGREPPEDRWWRNPLLPWLAAAAVVLGFLILLSRSGRESEAATLVLINLREHGQDPTLVVLLDGRPLTREELRKPVRVDAGEHQVVVKRGETVIAGSRFSIAEGVGTRQVPVVEGDELPVVEAEPLAAAEVERLADASADSGPGAASARSGGPSTGRATGTTAGGAAAPAGIKPLPPEPVEASLAMWSQRDSTYQPNPLQATIAINQRPPVRVESDLQHPVAADLRPGWNELRIETTPIGGAKAANDLKFRFGPVAPDEQGNPVMSPVLWGFHNGDDWKLKDGRYTHRIDPDAKSVRLSARLYYGGMRFENAQARDGDYILAGVADSEYRNASVTATVFVNGTGLNTFTSLPRQVVITPLLRKGHNEIRIVSSRVESCLTDNDVWVSVSGPAEWNASHDQFQTRPIASISGMTGWRRNQTTSLLENTIAPGSETIERVIPLYLADEPARAGRPPERPTLSVWSERSSAYQEANLHSDLRVNGRLVGVFTSDTRELVEPALKQNDWNEVTLRTLARHPGERLTSIKLQFGPARRNEQGELVMSPVLWWLDNGGDWTLDDGRLRHQLDPETSEVTLSTRVFYAGLERESAKVAKGDYVLSAEPGSEYYNPSVTSTVFINGTPLNSFTSQPRQVVITPLLKDGDNELRLVTVPVKNAFRENDISFAIAGPAAYNVAQQNYDFSPILEFTSLDGWRRDAASGQLVAADDPGRETIERVLRFRIAGLARQER